MRSVDPPRTLDCCILACSRLAAVLLAVTFNLPASEPLPLVWVLQRAARFREEERHQPALTDYKSGSLLGQDLVNAVPEIRQFANVKVEQISNVSSADISIANWITLANRVNQIFANDPKVAVS